MIYFYFSVINFILYGTLFIRLLITINDMLHFKYPHGGFNSAYGSILIFYLTFNL